MGKTHQTVELAEGETIQLIDAPKVYGYTFVEWQQDERTPDTVMGKNDITIEAKLNECDRFTVTYKLANDTFADALKERPYYFTNNSVESLYEGDFIPLPSFSGIVYLDGAPHRFNGWFIEGSNSAVPQTMPSHNLTLVARFELVDDTPSFAERHIVTYHSAFGTAPDQTEVAEKQFIPRPDLGWHDDNLFVGWYEDSDYQTPARTTMGNADLTLYARWINVTKPSPAEVRILRAMGYAFPAIAVETPAPTPTHTPVPTPTHTPVPTPEPTTEPTPEPTSKPTTEPTSEPTTEPSSEPTTEPSSEPTTEPSSEPTTVPTSEPTTEPAAEPSLEPSPEFTPVPVEAPDDGLNDELDDEPEAPAENA